MDRKRVTTLAEASPAIAAQWHPTKNGDLTPGDVTAGSGKRVWWKCDAGPDHEWEATASDRTRGYGCPMCAGKKVSVTNSLAVLYPSIAAQWHPTANGSLAPDDMTTGSSRTVWWVCNKGPDHEWQATASDRTTGHGCPMCAGKSVSVTNSLAALYPAVAAQWHPTRNGDLSPDQVVAGSHKKVWWICDQGPDHEWPATIKSRAQGGSGCPMCRGLSVSVTNSLAALNPAIAAQWHPTRNEDLAPDQVVTGSAKKVWWICDQGPDHEWEATVSNRTTGQGCSMCAGKHVSVTNSLASLRPDIAAQWHPTKNGDLTPDDVVAGTHRKVWWICGKGPDHEWDATANSRMTGYGCPMCAGKSISVTNSLVVLYPHIAAEWHPTRNDGLTPDLMTAGSNKKVWWICDQGPDHEWLATASNRTTGHGCPMCAGQSVSVTNSLASLRPDIAAQWHPTKNDDRTPDQVTAGSNKRVWWICGKGPDHEWLAPPAERLGDQNCAMCAGKSVSVTNSLAALYPAVAAQWHPTQNGDLSPDQVVAGSGRKAWWACDRGPDHEWDATVASRAHGDRGCPMCAGNSVSVTNSLAALYPAVAAQWHPTKNGELTPDQVTAGSNKKVWWGCPVDPLHGWPAQVKSRTSRGLGCPDCSVRPRSMIEVRITYEMATLTPLDPDDHRVETGKWTLDCDTVVRDHDLVIEFDGSFWHRKRRVRDTRKTKRLNDAGWRVIRIREEPLEPITNLDVRVPLGSSPKSVVDLLLPRLVELGLVSPADAGAYLSRTDLVAEDDSLEAVRAIQAERQAQAAH